MSQPTLAAPRLRLRPFTLSDAPAVREQAGDRLIADTTLCIPHPYEEGMAERWIGTHTDAFARGEFVNFAIVRKEDDRLVGAIGFTLSAAHNHAELGYWIGRPWWGKGYCTEAAHAVLMYGFKDRGLHRIYAQYFARNPASGRVMQKIGLRREGCLRGHVRKWDQYEDVETYGLLREEFVAGET